MQISEKLKKSLKKHLRGKWSLIRLFTYLCFYNGNVGLTKLIKVLSALYEQKLVD